MKRVTGIGGTFFKAKDAPALQAWYKRHLGIDVQEWGGTAFAWTDGEGNPVAGSTICSQYRNLHGQLQSRGPSRVGQSLARRRLQRARKG